MSRQYVSGRVLLLCGGLFLLMSDSAQAQESDTITSPEVTGVRPPKWAYGMEYLVPTKPDRPLYTTNFDLFYAPDKPNRTLRKARLTLFMGLTATTVSGTITQLVGSFEDGTLHNETYPSSANGIGPVLLLRYDLFRADRITFSLDASHGLMLYDRVFPAGGDRYNGMRRLGGSFTYRLDDRHSLNIGFRWMHGSNGKGVNVDNPVYEARGVNIQLLTGR